MKCLYTFISRVIDNIFNPQKARKFFFVGLIFIAEYTNPSAVPAAVSLAERVSRTEWVRVEVLSLKLGLNNTDGIAPDTVGIK